MQGLREAAAVAVGTTVGAAQVAGGFVADLAGGVASAAETAYEAGVSGVEATTGLIPDEHAAQQRADPEARANGLLAAAEEVINDPVGVAQAFAESYEARYAQAGALEAAYCSGHADLSALQEAARVRAEADAELGILGVETAATFGRAGALAKGLRAANIADRLDNATPLATAMATTQRSREATEAIADLVAEPGRTKPFTADDVEGRTGERLALSDGFAALAAERDRRGLPPAGAPDDTSTVARIEVDGAEFFGVNSRNQNPSTASTLDRVNAQTRTHAEADAVQRARRGGPRQGGRVELLVERDPCRACGANGGLRSLARTLGVDESVVHGPSGTQVYTPTR